MYMQASAFRNPTYTGYNAIACQDYFTLKYSGENIPSSVI